tara:strand:+ start:3050 stop:3793 length:744 start_codon:yes stop_codon:yes gene_type:complete
VKLAILLLALLGLAPGAHAVTPQYQVVTEEWAPYNYIQDGEVTGITTEIVRAIMALTGDQFGIQVVPSQRASRMLNEQSRTIMYSMFRTPERERLYKWVGPIVQDSIHPYQLASARPAVYSLQQLMAAPQITTRNAGLIPDLLQSLGFNNLDRSAAKNLQLYRMLLAGRTEIIIGDTEGGVAYYSRLLGIPPGTLRQVPVEIYRASLYIAFSADSDDALVAAWAQALETLRTSGELERIRLEYVPTP